MELNSKKLKINLRDYFTPISTVSPVVLCEPGIHFSHLPEPVSFAGARVCSPCYRKSFLLDAVIAEVTERGFYCDLPQTTEEVKASYNNLFLSHPPALHCSDACKLMYSLFNLKCQKQYVSYKK